MKKRDVLKPKTRKNVIMELVLCTMAALCVTACGGKKKDNGGYKKDESNKETTTKSSDGGDGNNATPLMFDINNGEYHNIDDKYGTCYEIFLRSFCDANGDGIGDINGLISKLDYINDGNPKSEDDLGADQIWLMPIHPSPSYHKYDVVDYMNIDEVYGNLDDFDNLVKECDKRGVFTDLTTAPHEIANAM